MPSLLSSRPSPRFRPGADQDVHRRHHHGMPAPRPPRTGAGRRDRQPAEVQEGGLVRPLGRQGDGGSHLPPALTERSTPASARRGGRRGEPRPSQLQTLETRLAELTNSVQGLVDAAQKPAVPPRARRGGEWGRQRRTNERRVGDRTAKAPREPYPALLQQLLDAEVAPPLARQLIARSAVGPVRGRCPDRTADRHRAAAAHRHALTRPARRGQAAPARLYRHHGRRQDDDHRQAGGPLLAGGWPHRRHRHAGHLPGRRRRPAAEAGRGPQNPRARRPRRGRVPAAGRRVRRRGPRLGLRGHGGPLAERHAAPGRDGPASSRASAPCTNS